MLSKMAFLHAMLVLVALNFFPIFCSSFQSCHMHILWIDDEKCVDFYIKSSSAIFFGLLTGNSVAMIFHNGLTFMYEKQLGYGMMAVATTKAAFLHSHKK